MVEKRVKFRLKGHESFSPREGWINKGLLCVNENSNVFSEFSGADALGVGSNMAKSIRYWLKACNLTYELQRQGTNLTSLGELILNKDGYFEDIFTIWITHINLVSNVELATTWNIFFNRCEIEEFSKADLYILIKHELEKCIGTDEYSEKSLDSDCTVLLNMYTKNKKDDYDPEDKSISPFASLGLIKYDKKKFIKSQPPLDKLNKLVVLYCILMMTKEKSISIDELLIGSNSPGRILNLNRIVLNEYLDQLEISNFLTVNRTAGLDIVYFKNEVTIEGILKEHYKTKLR